MSRTRLALCLALLLPLVAQAEEASSTHEITFDTLNFPIKKGEAFDRKMLTPEIEKLAGKRVRIAGYMLPGAEARGFREFVCIRDNMIHFGPSLPLADVILVKLVEGQAVDFTNKKITLDGVLEIREEKFPDGTTFAIYGLTAESVSRNQEKISTSVQPIPEGAGK